MKVPVGYQIGLLLLVQILGIAVSDETSNDYKMESPSNNDPNFDALELAQPRNVCKGPGEVCYKDGDCCNQLCLNSFKKSDEPGRISGICGNTDKMSDISSEARKLAGENVGEPFDVPYYGGTLTWTPIVYYKPSPYIDPLYDHPEPVGIGPPDAPVSYTEPAANVTNTRTVASVSTTGPVATVSNTGPVATVSNTGHVAAEDSAADGAAGDSAADGAAGDSAADGAAGDSAADGAAGDSAADGAARDSAADGAAVA